MLTTHQPGRLVQISSDLLSRGYAVRFRASGTSMRPAICHGDMLTVGPVAPSDLTPGSVAVYRRFDRMLAHRVVRIDADAAGAPVFVLRGDAASGCDAPVAASQVLGEVVKVERRTSAIRRHAGMLLQRLLRVRPPRFLVAMLVVDDSVGGLLAVLPAGAAWQRVGLEPRTGRLADLLDRQVRRLGRFFS